MNSEVPVIHGQLSSNGTQDPSQQSFSLGKHSSFCGGGDKEDGAMDRCTKGEPVGTDDGGWLGVVGEKVGRSDGSVLGGMESSSG